MEVETAKTQAVEYQLPMTHEYDSNSKSFYVRDCYLEYYDYVKDLLKAKKYITVTGTPGIGKSVFFMYFFQRYREEHPDKIIVTASFTKDRKLKKCVVFGPHQQEQERVGRKRKEIPFVEDDKECEETLHLYDGAPDMEPADNQMVCFCSPNGAWLNEMIKSSHMELLMPVWTLDELYAANLNLKLGLDDKIIEERYAFVGGSARLCLAIENVGYVRAKMNLISKIDNIKSFDHLEDILHGSVAMQKISHHLIHYDPVALESIYPWYFKLKFASPQMGSLIREEIQEKNAQDRNAQDRKNLVGWLKGSSAAAAFRGWLFEGDCNELLSRGGGFRCDSLKGGDSVSMVIPEPSTGLACYIPSPKTNTESVDGFYFNSNTNDLFLLQMTLNTTHPVSALGIIDVIKSLQLSTESFKALKSHLVFVVASSMTNFPAQTIKMPDFSKDNSLRSIRGIGSKSEQDLDALGIRTVEDLQRAINHDENVRKSFGNRWEHHANLLKEQDKWKFVSDIPQYVFVTNLDYKDYIGK